MAGKALSYVQHGEPDFHLTLLGKDKGLFHFVKRRYAKKLKFYGNNMKIQKKFLSPRGRRNVLN